MYDWLSIDAPEDFGDLGDYVEEEYSPDDVADKLEECLSASVKGVLIEHDYVDKDYRSTYYNFYAKKGQRFSSYCVRLHFFGEGVRLTDDLRLEFARDPKQSYFGFMVLRPTPVASIGRTILSVEAVDGFHGALITSEHVVHLLGERLSIEGFPYMEQHTDISVCAHAACWSILRHFSSRYRQYSEFLIHDISQMASPHDPGGLLPSRGLRIDEACRVFSSAGLFPDVYNREGFPDGKFYRLLMAYVDSGIPIFAVMTEKTHAFTIIGHGAAEVKDLDPNIPGPHYWWDAINSYLVVDDNFMPYRRVGSLDSETDYEVNDIDAFVVPLPDKIFLPAEATEQFARNVLNATPLGLDLKHIKTPVIRYFLTTSARFRHFVKDCASLVPQNLYRALLGMALPQFLWVVQLGDIASVQGGKFDVLALIDATASERDEWPYFFMHDQKTGVFWDRAYNDSREISFDRKLEYWLPFKGNLRGYI